MKNLQVLIICITLLFLISLGCASSSSNKISPSSIKGNTSSTGSSSDRRQLAEHLQRVFADWDNVSIYTKGDNDEILYVSFEGMASNDKSKADQVMSQFRSKIEGYGFKQVEFSNGRKIIASYDLDE